MNYKKITDITSKQYSLVNNLNKSEDGLLRDNEGYIAVALGSYYGEVGDRFIIKFSTNKEIKVIKADEKDDNDTINGCYHKTDNSMIEVLIQVELFKENFYESYVMGDLNYSDLFNGSIVKISKVIY